MSTTYLSRPSPLLTYCLIFILALASVCVLASLARTGGTQPPRFSKEDLQMIEDAVEEANRIIPDLTPGNKGYLSQSTGGYLRIYKHTDGKLFVVGAENDWLRSIAQEIALRIGATVP